MKFDTKGNLMSATDEQFAKNQATKITKYWSSVGRNDIYAEAIETRSGWRVVSNANSMLASKK
jgi:hypothetical protein